MPEPTAKMEAEFGLCRRAVLFCALVVSAAFLFGCLYGCRAPDRTVLAADAMFFNAIGREYEANLEAGKLWRLERNDAAGTVTLTADMQPEHLERRRRTLRMWRRVVEEGRIGEYDGNAAEKVPPGTPPRRAP